MKAKNTVVLIHKKGNTSYRFTHFIPELDEEGTENIRVKETGKVYKIKKGSKKDLWEMVLKKLRKAAIQDKGKVLKTRVFRGFKTPKEVKAISKKLSQSTD